MPAATSRTCPMTGSSRQRRSSLRGCHCALCARGRPLHRSPQRLRVACSCGRRSAPTAPAPAPPYSPRRRVIPAARPGRAAERSTQSACGAAATSARAEPAATTGPRVRSASTSGGTAGSTAGRA
jgi:hypothetical protein